VTFVGTPGYAQDRYRPHGHRDPRDKLKAEKKVVGATNLQLTDAEAKAFRPIYDAVSRTSMSNPGESE
jgi:hypothetical protein